MKPYRKIVALYSAIALLSILVNIGTQAIVVTTFAGHRITEISVLAGTISGLPFKYFLDKKFIFNHEPRNIFNEGKTFSLYVFVSAFTTAIFWALEYVFDMAFQTLDMRYFGAFIGLIIGNISKYFLDVHYVFRDRAI